MTTKTEPDEILSIKQLSEYLMVSEKTIYRMLERNKLPAARIGGQWRFRRRDIDGWIDNQVRKVDVEGDRQLLADLGPSEIAIAPLLDQQNIWLNVPPMSRDELLHWMVLQAKLDEGVNLVTLAESVLEREQTCSTALLPHAAFPHPNDPGKFRFSRKRVLLAITSEPIDFLDPHGHRPRVIAMILARRVQGYLLTISRAIKLFNNDLLIERLIRAKRPSEIIVAIRKAEKNL